jgi:hypothetical protein
MKLKLAWYKTNQNNIIEGICDKLPDDFCKFMISKLTDNTFVINLPGRGTENFDKRIRVSDANARQRTLRVLSERQSKTDFTPSNL